MLPINHILIFARNGEFVTLPMETVGEVEFNAFLAALGRYGKKDADKAWNEPFHEDENLCNLELAMGKMWSGLAFVEGETIISQDKNQYCLSSPLAEEI